MDRIAHALKGLLSRRDEGDQRWHFAAMEVEDAPDESIPRPVVEVGQHELVDGLTRLFFMDDLFLRMQVTNLTVTDQVLMQLEENVLERLIREESTPIDDTIVLLAFSQMWIFAAYELLRTWRGRVKDVDKWLRNGGLASKIASLEAKGGPFNPARSVRIVQLKRAQEDPQATAKAIALDLRRTHVTFSRLEALRVSLAKHEVAGKPKMIARAPGYARIDRWTGSLQFELSTDNVILDVVTRRDIADAIRAFVSSDALPNEDELRSFDTVMSGAEIDKVNAMFGDADK